ncbi:hypothetical protein CLIB1423_02S05908 [[Candida] railenensis]|uniref:TUG ubiquitin-like domain-containing protein n=1 Tax=[Candida] railenensis TaxID=45579 RepID=A0A9P0VWU7_9ASCO|nr:hypothetical protein CLIB1423_02S05908 [[Candida] railenensis]
MSFQVTYKLKTLKVTCPANSSISQLTELAKKKFKLDGDTVVDLLYKDKVLDSSLPLRFANISNNAKLVLKVSESESKEISIKLTLPTGGSHITKINNHKTIADLLNMVENERGTSILDQEKFGSAQLQVLNSKLNETDFPSSRIVSIVGNGANSVVCRLSYANESDKDRRIEEQNRIVKLQVEEQRVRNQMKKEEEKMNEDLLARKRAEEREQGSTNDATGEEMEVDDGTEGVREVPKEETKTEKSNAEETRAEETRAEEIEEEDDELESAVEHSVQVNTPQIFLPSDSASGIYDHSEETYEMTVAQAQTYHKILTDSMRPQKPKQRIHRIPETYFVRIKFPDLSTLQLTFSDGPTVKFGSLLKKLDEMLLPEFRNRYNLKFGYPPFTLIPFSFKTNDQFLHEFKVSKNSNDAFAERMLLIWELTDSHSVGGDHKGPYINKQGNDVIVTTNNERPEIQLESHRGDLPDDKEEKKHKKDEGKKLPKWLKLNK